jgi:hypothetical protein
MDHFILHTGQHYSYTMDKVFFEQLGLPEAKYNLDAGSGMHGEQTGKMLARIEKVLLEEKPDVREEAIGEAINLGSGREHRVIDMATMVNELAGNENGVVYNERRDWDVKNRFLSSIKKAQKLLGYKPEMEFKDGLKKVHEWFVENRNNIDKSAEF